MDEKDLLKRVKLEKHDLEKIFAKIIEKDSLRNVSRRCSIPYSTLGKWKRNTVGIPYGQFKKLLRLGCFTMSDFDYKLEDMRWGFVTWKTNGKKLRRIMMKRVKGMAGKCCRQRAKETVTRRYGELYFKKIGLKGAESGRLTRREVEITRINRNSNAEMRWKTHATVMGSNIDFVYPDEHGDIYLFEEVIGARKKKSLTYYEVAKVHEKILKIKKPFMVTAWYEQRYGVKTERFPLEVVLWLLENRIALPILIDIDIFGTTRKKVIGNPAWAKPTEKLCEFCRKELAGRDLRRGAKAQYNTPMTALETAVHHTIKKCGYAPVGKKIIGTRYGPEIVVDDYIPRLNAAVVVAPTSLEDIIGSAFGLKMLCDENLKVIGVIGDARARGSKISKNLLAKYVDRLCIGVKELGSMLETGW